MTFVNWSLGGTETDVIYFPPGSFDYIILDLQRLIQSFQKIDPKCYTIFFHFVVFEINFKSLIYSVDMYSFVD